MNVLRMLVCLFAFLACSAVSAQMKGDVNEDQNADISDVVVTINIMSGSNSNMFDGDVNKDDKVDISDVVAIINIMAGFGDDDNPGGEEAIEVLSPKRTPQRPVKEVETPRGVSKKKP